MVGIPLTCRLTQRAPDRWDSARFQAFFVASNGFCQLDDPSTSRFVQPQSISSGGGRLVSALLDYFYFLSMLLKDGDLELGCPNPKGAVASE